MKTTLFGVILLTLFFNLAMAADVKGDLRYRMERIDENGKDARLRDRIRARLGFYGQVDEHFDYSARLASGSTDPVSANQTLDDSFSSKGINLDLAYLTFNCPITGVEAQLGKMKNPYKNPGSSSLLWDGDLNPEGIALNAGRWGVFLNLGRHWLEEKSGAPDAMLHGAQLGYEKEMGSVAVMIGASYFDYLAIKNQTTLVDSTNSFGNSATANLYDNDYNLTELFLELKSLHHPVTLYFDYVKNSEASSDDTGWLAGLSFGKKLNFNYNYRKLEKDAVLAAFTDSDFKGGGTDGKGHMAALGYKTTSKTKLSLTHFLNKSAVTNGTDYHRTQLDFSLKF